MARPALRPVLLLMLAACSEPPSGSGAATLSRTSLAQETAQRSGAAEAELPRDFVRTAWRVTAPDGARYITYLDPGGRYRDLRNGDPWRDGQWTSDDDGRICFRDTAEGASDTCWTPERMRGERAMILRDAGGGRVLAERVDYAPATEADPPPDSAPAS